MDKESGKNLIKETLQNSFDKERFVYFIKNLLNSFDESKAFHARGYVPEIFKTYIKTYERIATYNAPDDKKIDILIVYLQRETSLERARSAQRNFIARYLKGRDEKDAGLIAFVSPNDEWRFSFVKMEYKFVETPKGTIKAKEDFTPARRYSFLVGRNENSHTAQSRLVPILLDDENNPALAELENAFSVEKVTKEFFEKYRELFLWTEDTLNEVIKNDKKIRNDFEAKGVNAVDFSKKLLGQVVFLYFLQKKGWFGVERDADWGSGPKNFLRQLFACLRADTHRQEGKHLSACGHLPAHSLQGGAQAGGEYSNFFNDILEPLFYEALAIERPDDFYSRFNCKIPFLNGGLFDPINNYDWVHTDIILPNELFSNNIKTKDGDTGTGILDVFDRYNFTVKEDEPLEKEVAVDPEMLGKVFENLLDVKDRKSKGTYYTPREIVHYMCEQSLVNYLSACFAQAELATELSSAVIASEAKQSLPTKEDFEKLIKYGESVGENEARVEKKGEETDTYYYKLPESIHKHAKLIDEKLANIKVCDPAIGSGAFPVGMMHEIVKARQTLTAYISPLPLRERDRVRGDLSNARTIYDFKRDCIQNSLYGVDLDPGAVEIAKLRLWLSLVVDEEERENIQPLPNLDYKIMQGNSLLEEFEGIKLFDEKIITSGDDYRKKEIEMLKQKQSRLQTEYFGLHAKSKLTPIKQAQFNDELKTLDFQIKKLGRKELQLSEDAELFDILSVAKQKAEELKQLHKEFFETTHKKKKDELKIRIEALEWELIEATLREQNKSDALKKLELFKKSNTKPFFLWKLHFADVFEEKDGFDIVIANPPYVRQEDIKSFKPALQKEGYEVYNSTSDLYTYFYEKSYHILKEQGFSCFISSNKWMRAKYGEKLRKFFKEKSTLKQIIDFNGYQVFDATVDTNVLLYQKNIPSDGTVNILNIQPDFTADMDINEYSARHNLKMKQSSLDIKCFTFGDDTVMNLKRKIEEKGTPLKDWDVKIYRGILTGFNEAFIIDTETKEKLCREDPRSAEIIKPILRGRDINKYYYQWAGLWIIKIESGWTNKNRGKSKPETFFEQAYPATYKYLKNIGDKVERGEIKAKGKGLYKRDDQGDYWWELRDCNYYQEFEKEKIIYPNMTKFLPFVYDNKKYYTNQKCYILTGKTNLKFLLCILNSSLFSWYIRFLFPELQGGTRELNENVFRNISIPKIPEKDQHPFVTIVTQIFSAKQKDYKTNTTVLEREIDRLVYNLYGLTEEEIEIVENFSKK